MSELASILARRSVWFCLETRVGRGGQVFLEEVVWVAEWLAKHLPVALGRRPSCMALLGYYHSFVREVVVFFSLAHRHVSLIVGDVPR